MTSEERRANWIKKATLKHGGKYNYSKVKYKNAKTHVKIICPIHNVFLQAPGNHLSYGCKQCGSKRSALKQTMSVNEFKRKAINKFGNVYDYKKVKKIIAKKKITIICPKHGDFKQTAVTHLQQKGCPNCSRENANKHTKFTRNTFIKACNKKFNNKFDYSSIQFDSLNSVIEYKCPQHGIRKKKAQLHLYGSKYGCSACGNEQRKNNKGIRYTEEEFLSKCRIAHGNKYIYDEVKYNGCNNEIKIRCKAHGIFKQNAGCHIQGQGCQPCAYENNGRKCTFTQEEFIKRSQSKHGDKFDYSKTHYQKSNIKIIVTCKKHNYSFPVIPSIHLYRNSGGCTKCTKIGKHTVSSFIEKSNEVHNNRYDYSKINMNNSEVTIICPEHGEFNQDYRRHSQGAGCDNCAIKERAEFNTCTTQIFIAKAEAKHGKNTFIYNKVNYIKNNVPVLIICQKHKHEFLQKPCIHLQGSGCTKCVACPNCELWKTNGKLCRYCTNHGQNKQFRKTKEFKTIKFLKENLMDYDFIEGRKSIGNLCHKNDKKEKNGHLFPDVRIEFCAYMLIIEIDEFRHRGASYDCDEQRMINIVANIGQPCIFIRYNPDNKNSDLDVLLETVKKYLDLECNDKIWEEMGAPGFAVEYLFYTKIREFKAYKTMKM